MVTILVTNWQNQKICQNATFLHEKRVFMADSANIKKFVKSLQVICHLVSTKVLNPSLCLFGSMDFKITPEFCS
jgi:hypothetical protein